MTQTEVGLTQDQVLAQLRTRGYEEGFQRTPLRDFWGTLTDIGGTMRQGDRGAFLVVLYNFGGNDLEVIDSAEPYTSPIAQLEIPHSSRRRSGMGYFGASVDKVINAGIPEEVLQDGVKNQDYIIGKRLHMKLTPGHLIWDQRAGEERPRDCWELMEVAGEGASATPPAPGAVAAPVAPVQAVVSASQTALDLLDGKNEQQWHQVVFVNDVVKADSAIVNAIIGRTFLQPLEDTGIVTKDADGVYHVKKD